MYRFKFAAIVRTDKKRRIHYLSAIANTEREARKLFAGKFVLFFSARLPASGV
jgi:hypothetical protein